MSADEMTPGKLAYLAWAESLGVYDRWDDFTAFYHDAWEVAAAVSRTSPEQVWLDPEPVVLRPEPRVFRAGDPEPDGVRAVLDREVDLWQRSKTGWWYSSVDDVEDWATMMEFDGPVVEVILPTAVTA